MSTLNISLPEEMRAFVDEQVARGGYSTASEYIRGLIREDQQRKAQQELEEKLLEGIQSGSGSFNAEDWNAIREEARRRLKRKRAA